MPPPHHVFFFFFYPIVLLVCAWIIEVKGTYPIFNAYILKSNGKIIKPLFLQFLSSLNLTIELLVVLIEEHYESFNM